MLIKCPECELQASDKASACPHCGYPFQTNSEQKKVRKSNKRRRLPNGFGQISEIKNRNLRNPFRAMVTVGKDSKGKPVCKLLKPVSYFHTYNEAYSALMEYNKHPGDMYMEMKMYQLFDKWVKDRLEPSVGESALRTNKSAWNYCSSIYDMNVSDVRIRHLRYCIEEGTAIIKGEERTSSPIFKQKIKSLLNNLFDYAVEYEVTDKNYARAFKISDKIVQESSEDSKEHISFTDEEMRIIWDNEKDTPYADILLIQCYSGWRPRELGLIRIENVDLNEWSFIGGMKTKAGTYRKVPVHPRIREFVKRRYDEAVGLGSEYVFNCPDSKERNYGDIRLTYDRYRGRFNKIIDKLNLNPDHRPHDPRMQFVTMAKRYGVDEYAIKHMVGHYIDDITEKIYTKRDFSWFETEIQKIR